MQEILSNILLGSLAVIFGFVMLLAPDGVYLILVNLLLVVLGISSLWMIVRFFKRRNILDFIQSSKHSVTYTTNYFWSLLSFKRSGFIYTDGDQCTE